MEAKCLKTEDPLVNEGPLVNENKTHNSITQIKTNNYC